jgi:eukaryotic-like serine/threonine-protein kinase
MASLIGFLTNRMVAEREGVDRDRANQLGLIGGLIGGPGISVPGIVVTQMIARREAPAAPPGPPGPALVEVPDVSGQPFGQAEKLLQDLGLVVQPSPEESSTVASGLIIRQNPQAGAQIAAGDPVTLIVSVGVTVPDVVGLEFTAAAEELEARGLLVRREDQPSDAVKRDFVFRQQPAPGSTVEPGTTVTLTVSVGAGVAVPDLVAKKAGDAEKELRKLGLVPDQLKEPSEAFEIDFVFAQDPAAGAVAQAGAIVTLRVSTGPPVVIP